MTLDMLPPTTSKPWRTKLDPDTEYQVFGVVDYYHESTPLAWVEDMVRRMRLKMFEEAWNQGWTPIEERREDWYDVSLIDTRLRLDTLCIRRTR